MDLEEGNKNPKIREHHTGFYTSGLSPGKISTVSQDLRIWFESHLTLDLHYLLPPQNNVIILEMLLFLNYITQTVFLITEPIWPIISDSSEVLVLPSALTLLVL